MDFKTHFFSEIYKVKLEEMKGAKYLSTYITFWNKFKKTLYKLNESFPYINEFAYKFKTTLIIEGFKILHIKVLYKYSSSAFKAVCVELNWLRTGGLIDESVIKMAIQTFKYLQVFK